MDKTYIFSFTDRGNELAHKLAEELKNADGREAFITKVSGGALNSLTASAFEKRNTLIFIGAAAIAVRAIGQLIRSKTEDPAVIVIDENAQFVIPVLSGHIGGANSQARRIAELIGAAPVITTATDINSVFSIDTFATEKRFAIINPEEIKHVSAALLKGENVGLLSDFPVSGKLPELIELAESGEIGVCISFDTAKKPFRKTLSLTPKRFHAGIGARKNVEPKKLELFFLDTLSRLSIPIEAVSTLSSVDLKKDEKAINALSEKYEIPFITYSPSRLNEFSELFCQSELVRNITGTGNVCEAAAYISSGKGEIVLPKTRKDGATLALAKERTAVCF